MVALSSCEAGYIVTSMGACQGLWFEDLMSKSKIRRGDYEDANRQQVSQLWLNILLLMKLELKYPITNEQVTDILTKPLKIVWFKLNSIRVCTR